MVDETGVDERVSVTGDDLVKMKTLPIRLPIEVEVADWHEDKELLGNMEMTFKPGQTFKGEAIHFVPQEIVGPDMTTRHKCPTSASELPEEREKRAQAAAKAAAKAKAKAGPKSGSSSSSSGGITVEQQKLLDALKAFNAGKVLQKHGHEVGISAELAEKDTLTEADKKKAMKEVVEAAEKAEIDQEVMLKTLQGQKAETTAGKKIDVEKHQFQQDVLGGSSSSSSGKAKAKASAITLSTLPVLGGLHEEVRKRAIVDLVNGGETNAAEGEGTPLKKSRTNSPVKFV